MLRGRDEVVEDVLLALAHAGAMPGLAVLAATAQVGEREHAAVIEERKVARIVRRRPADVETAVAAEQDRTFAVRLHAGTVDEKHRDPRAVLAWVPHLGGLIPNGVAWRAVGSSGL